MLDFKKVCACLPALMVAETYPTKLQKGYILTLKFYQHPKMCLMYNLPSKVGICLVA